MATVEVSVISGSNQAAVVSQAFATSLVALCRDGAGIPQAGVGVSVTLPPSGASCTLVGPIITDANGKVTLAATANATQGTYNVTFAVAGATSALFVLKNANATVVVLPFVSPDGAVQIAGGTFSWVNPSGLVSLAGPPATANATLPNVSNSTNELHAEPWSQLNNIPANATITAITIKASFRATIAGGSQVGIDFAKIGGATGGAGAAINPLTTAFQVAQGTDSNVGVFNFTPANIASTFRVRAVCYGSTVETQYQTQACQAQITYTTPPTPPLSTASSPLIFCEA